MSAEDIRRIDTEDVTLVRPTEVASRTHANPLVRMGAVTNDYIHHRVAVRRSGRAVDIFLPTEAVADPITEEDLIYMLSPAINGDTDAKEQGVHIQYLSNDERLVLPQYIAPTADSDAGLVATSESFGMVRALADASRASIEEVIDAIATETELKSDESKAVYASIPEDAKESLTITNTRVFIGVGGRTSFRIPALATDMPGPEEKADNVPVISVLVSSGSGALVNFSFQYGASIDVVAIRFAHAVGLNADPRDFAALARNGMRLSDKAFQSDEPLPLERFRSKLKAFTVTCIAALNYSRLKEIPLLAWTRAYLVSAGVLSDALSKNQSELAYSRTRPSKTVVKKLSEYHDRDSQRVLLAAYSVGAMFGLEHLARDHTYKGGDEVLLRVNKAYEKALSTVLQGDEAVTLASFRHETHRLTCHPFGLSQCYTLARWGAHHRRIAEALQIRENVCPPALNRISLAVGVFKQVCSLPVGVVVRSIFQADHAIAEKYLHDLGKRRSQFSALAWLYGWERTEKVDHRVLDAVNRMMPMLAGYAEAFHTTDPKNGQPLLTGAALAASISNIKRDNGALVQLFSGLFSKYIEASKEQGLEQFLINQRNAIRLAMGSPAEENNEGYLMVAQQ